jgi:hypothetical protein
MYKIIAVCLVLFITACGEAEKVPKDVLSKEKMRDVLLDMNMADAYAGLGDDGVSLVISDSIRKERLRLYYRQILDLHKLSPQEFNHSYAYYEAHPEKLKSVYDMMFALVTADKNNLELAEKQKEYVNNRHSLLPVNNNTLISGQQDTLIPFVKKEKRGVNSNSMPPEQVNLPKQARLQKGN